MSTISIHNKYIQPWILRGQYLKKKKTKLELGEMTHNMDL
jgi:hypothetical protein